MKSVAIYTLGCKVNQVETEAMAESFSKKGYLNVDFSDYADVYIINTCSVTQVADRKSRAAIRRAKRRNPDSLLVVTGCFSEIFSKEVISLPEVDLVVANRDKDHILDRVERYLNSLDDPVEHITDGKLVPVKYFARHQRTRGFVKIQDGCENFCSYCIVPYARGPVRSKEPQYVKDEITNLIELGYKEIVLNGIHIGQYGKDLARGSIAELLGFILEEIQGEYRLRLGSMEPNDIDEKLLDLFTDSRVCRHLHIPIQSGSDQVLSRMNRKYTAGQYSELLFQINKRIPGIGLTTDVMVGFPGEGEKEFLQTMEVIDNSPLSDLHVFRFSSRPGTPAASFKERVPEAEKTRRSQALISLGKRKRSEFLEVMKGHELKVLVEEGVRGLSDNYIDVLIDGQCHVNQFCRVKITGTQGDKLRGEAI